ncbi:hypothetical protein OAM69_06405 [bacterium]|nr:hypothetical protein [bacterium]
MAIALSITAFSSDDDDPAEIQSIDAGIDTSGPNDNDNPATGGAASSQLSAGRARQWAYRGQSLYVYSGDSAAGDTNGNGVGGVWSLVDQALAE